MRPPGDSTMPLDEQGSFSRDEAHEVFKQFASHYDAPAYVRRARQVEDAYEQLLARCRATRDDWLKLVRVRLGLLRMQAVDWTALAVYLADASAVDDLERLHADLQPRLRLRVAATTAPRTHRRTLGEVAESIERFNRRWAAFLPAVDLSAVNALREDYNRYYLLEKECAVRSPRLARQGYQRLEPLTAADLAAVLPLLPSVRLRD